MADKKIIKAVIAYQDFLNLNENRLVSLLENEHIELLISIKKNEYQKLNDEQKSKLYGFRRTELEPLRKPKIKTETLFMLKELPKIVDVKIIEQTYKDKHLKTSHPYTPHKLFYAGYNSKKKGGRRG